jgi:hypothetical protein
MNAGKRQLVYCYLLCFLLGAITLRSLAQKQSAITPGNGNPIIPGYFADPTIKKFGDTYYLYATTDGNGGGHGPSQVWTSKDFVNWTMQDMNWPTTNYYWAPDVTKGNDSNYYMYYCQPVEIYGAASSSPVGPWTPLLPDGKAMIPNYFVPGVITLDGQTFRDDDGKFYMFWGTWGIYPNHGCGVGLMNPDMKSFTKTAKIPNTIAKDFFEGPFMFQRKGIYYLTYSSGACENETYRVQYAISKTGPMGPFEFGKNNPILSTNEDGTIHGPGHESVIQVEDDFYMIYHRHNNPHSNGGFHRQVCADKIVFDQEGNMEKLVPTHTGIGFLGKNTNPFPNLAYQKKATASSFYNADYQPAFAVDDNNGTLWKPADNSADPAWIQIDLDTLSTIKRVLTQFEYATWYYQYRIEYSPDGKRWKIFADRTDNRQHGSPMVDEGNVSARYLRLTITGTEYPGLYKAVWNIKVFSEREEPTSLLVSRPYRQQTGFEPKPASRLDPESISPEQQPAKSSTPKVLNIPEKEFSNTTRLNADSSYDPHPLKGPAVIANNQYEQKGLLVDLDAALLQQGIVMKEWKNNGALGGIFYAAGKAPIVDIIAGRKAIVFNGAQLLESSFQVPRSLSGDNSYTVAFWAYTSKINDEGPIVSWAGGRGEHTGASFGYGSNRVSGAAQHFGFSDLEYNTVPEAGKWHYIAVVFDGTFEKVFVDGLLNNQENKMLFIQCADKFVIGSKINRVDFYSGAISSLKIYDRPLPDTTIENIFKQPQENDIVIYLDASKLQYGRLQDWKNEGVAGSSFTTSAGHAPLVRDIAGKIAVNFSGKKTLSFKGQLAEIIDKSNSFSLVVSVYKPAFRKKETVLTWLGHKAAGIDYGPVLRTGQWHLIIKTVEGNNSKEYIDGLLQPSESEREVKDKSGLLYLGAGGNGNEFSGALTSLTVYKRMLTDNEIKAFNDAWMQSSHPLVNTKLSFSIKPKAVTPNIVEMKAAAAGVSEANLQYWFTNISENTPAKTSGWTDNPYYMDYGLSADRRCCYTFKIRDNFGNVTRNSSPFKVSTATSLFSVFSDNFSVVRNFLSAGTDGTIWDGLIGRGGKQVANLTVSADHVLTLASEGSNWDGNAPYGPFIYKKVAGNFVAEVEVADVSGLAEKKVTGNNDVGLMVRLPKDLTTLNTAKQGISHIPEQALQNSIFPAWNVGNLLTNLSDQSRMQSNTQAGWKYNRFLQIQRDGNLFSLRSSNDGITWADLPGSPVLRMDMKDKPVQVGLYQCTYGPQRAYGKFSNFRLVVNK